MLNIRLTTKFFHKTIPTILLKKTYLENKIINRHFYVTHKNFVINPTINIIKCLNTYCLGDSSSLSNIYFLSTINETNSLNTSEIVYNIPYCADCVIEHCGQYYSCCIPFNSNTNGTCVYTGEHCYVKIK